MKIASVVHALDEVISQGAALSYTVVHTGQHYDRNMSGSFFDELGIPAPRVNLGVGSGTAAEQTAGIMIGYERVISENPPDLCLVVGDVTSTMACAIVARKAGIPVAHVEGGIRSGDWTMPEEINRVVTDSISNWFFTTSEFANSNLRNAGVEQARILFVGNTMIDTLLRHRPHFRAPAIWAQEALAPGGYCVLTLHRPSNVDNPKALRSIFDAIRDGARGMRIVFPVHPRTASIVRSSGLDLSGYIVAEPLPYLEFNYLVEHARCVLTDSGGVTEETTVMGVPCLTLRENTERPETVEVGTNRLVGTAPAAISAALRRAIEHGPESRGVPNLWDGNAGRRIVEHLRRLLA